MNMWMEWVGYTASVLVAISLWMSNIWKLRWINLAGSMVFVVYGLSIGAYPVAAMNTICCGLNVYYIVQMANRKEFFSYLIAEDVNSAFIRYFIRFYEQDMRKYFPEFSEKTLRGERVRVIVVLRNAAPVGLFMYHKVDEYSAMIDLDYAVPEYRDLENIRFLLREGLAERFQQEEIRSFVVQSRVPAHVQYLRKLGFEPCAEQSDCYRMPL
ncbi:MAG: hypothetical protein PHP44_09150 [Kiritimatiellae bacterium]|nr:hypothetical protein [Kiritimatiellia bacterium]